MVNTSRRPESEASAEFAAALDAVAVLGRLASVFVERRRQLAESVGLTDQQWQALEQVQTEDFMPSLFAQKRDTTAAAVSKILRQLADKGLIIPHVSEADGRQRSYEITARGREVLEQVRRERERVIRSVWMAEPPRELEQFAQFGAKIARALEQIAAEERRREREPIAAAEGPGE